MRSKIENTIYMRKWRKKNRLRYREIIRKATAKWFKKNKSKRNIYMKAYHQRLEVKPNYIVRQKTNRAIKLGLIKKLNCEICGRKAEAHHPDYSKPLKVQWLCKKHHAELHIIINATK